MNVTIACFRGRSTAPISSCSSRTLSRQPRSRRKPHCVLPNRDSAVCHISRAVPALRLVVVQHPLRRRCRRHGISGAYAASGISAHVNFLPGNCCQASSSCFDSVSGLPSTVLVNMMFLLCFSLPVSNFVSRATSCFAPMCCNIQRRWLAATTVRAGQGSRRGT